jgi:hypothetical protein
MSYYSLPREISSIEERGATHTSLLPSLSYTSNLPMPLPITEVRPPDNFAVPGEISPIARDKQQQTSETSKQI